MWEPVATLVNAQTAVSHKLADHWLAFLRASCVPALLAVGALIWMVQAYWASTAFVAGQVAVLLCAAALVLFLSTLSVGRMIRIGLKLDSAPAGLRALKVERADTRMLMVTLGLIALVVIAGGLQDAVGKLVRVSFVAPGSDAIARPVLAGADALILLGLYYLLGRFALFLPACAALPDSPGGIIWRATEGHGAILFIVALAVPLAVAGLLAGPVLWWIGALPWPSPSDFAGTESLAIAMADGLYLVAPALFLAIMGGWALAAAGLCAAWEALKERGVLDLIEAAG